ncbi:MAG: methyltransferase family protein [Paracoccaceae bacterium]|jgi:protein-S-isoprenylcysteine O-methyltransferase Ste14
MMARWLNIPPVWLALALVIAYFQARNVHFGLSLSHPITDMVAGLSIGAGVLLMALAVVEMRRHRTTMILHREADHLVTTGVFKWTRNPIYLGDAMVLLGFILHWDAVLSLAILPIFVMAIDYGFIAPEEDRLRRKFRSDFERYMRDTRRWI